MTGWGDAVETERRNRIMVSLYAYAYEVMDDSLVSDAEYDALCSSIDATVMTGNEVMDKFFRDEFNASTGMWIYRHPEAEKLPLLYHRVTGRAGKEVAGFSAESFPVTADVSRMKFRTSTDAKIYLASLGFNVVGHTLVGSDYGVLDFEFDREYFYVTQRETGVFKAISYRDYFGG